MNLLALDRLVPAPPERTWQAWTTEEGLARWWWSHLPGVTRAVDLRVGGSYRFVAPEQGFGVEGAYLEIEAPRRLVFTWRWLDDGVPGEEERVVVVLTAEGDGTRIAIEHTGPWTTPEPAESYRVGWEQVLDALAAR